MRIRTTLVALASLVATGCVEQVTPTEPLIEQAVFNALGGLHIGESLELTGLAARDILLGGTAVGGDFVVVPFHASQVQGERLIVEISGERITAGAAQSLARQPTSPETLLEPEVVAGWEMHESLHARQTRAVEPMLARLGATLSLSPGVASPRTDLGGTNASVGQLVQINANALGPACTADDSRTGRVEAITDHAILVGDIANPSGGFTRADYEEFGQQFDDLVYPTVTEYFAEPTDIDDNEKVVIFFTRAVNELTGPDDEGFVGGFFWARDLFPIADCGVSNAGEIFFILAPDPNAEASHIAHSRERVFNQGVATIGHEFQHLINAGRRIYVNGASRFEESWLDEGLSHIAEELLFYEASGLSPKSNIDREDVSSAQNPQANDAINRFGVQNLVRYLLYLEDVTNESPTNRDRLETRGAIWSFLRYAADHSERPQTQFFTALGDTPLTGFQNLSAVLAEAPMDRFQDWGVAVYTDDLLQQGDSTLQQLSWNFRSLLPVLNNGVFPLEVETLTPGDTEVLSLVSTTSGYVRVQGTGGATSQITVTSGSSNPPDELRVTVVRME